MKVAYRVVLRLTPQVFPTLRRDFIIVDETGSPTGEMVEAGNPIIDWSEFCASVVMQPEHLSMIERTLRSGEVQLMAPTELEFDME